MRRIGRELVGLWWRPGGTEGRLSSGVKLIRVWRGCIYTKVYWAGLFFLITGPHRLLRFFRLTEPKNRINLTYFGYLKLGTELEPKYSVSVSSVLVPVILVRFLVLGYFCLGLDISMHVVFIKFL